MLIRKTIIYKILFLVFEKDLQPRPGHIDSCLTPATDSDLPLLIEEYHQLFRIVMLHELEDARETVKDCFNDKIKN